MERQGREVLRDRKKTFMSYGTVREGACDQGLGTRQEVGELKVETIERNALHQHLKCKGKGGWRTKAGMTYTHGWRFFTQQHLKKKKNVTAVRKAQQQVGF